MYLLFYIHVLFLKLLKPRIKMTKVAKNENRENRESKKTRIEKNENRESRKTKIEKNENKKIIAVEVITTTGCISISAIYCRLLHPLPCLWYFSVLPAHSISSSLCISTPGNHALPARNVGSRTLQGPEYLSQHNTDPSHISSAMILVDGHQHYHRAGSASPLSQDSCTSSGPDIDKQLAIDVLLTSRVAH